MSNTRRLSSEERAYRSQAAADTRSRSLGFDTPQAATQPAGVCADAAEPRRLSSEERAYRSQAPAEPVSRSLGFDTPQATTQPAGVCADTAEPRRLSSEERAYRSQAPAESLSRSLGFDTPQATTQPAGVCAAPAEPRRLSSEERAYRSQAHADTPAPRLGLIVNPVAGIGGPAGLKGSDGIDVQLLAQQRGAHARAGERAAAALAVVAQSHPGIEVLTASGALGEHAVLAAGLTPRIVYTPAHTHGAPDAEPPAATTAADTQAAVAALAQAGAQLILFVGGDGTARDVCSGLEAAGASHVAALGVPAGVKMYSACFAVSPSAAGALAAATLGAHDALPLRQSEILDVVEEQLRHGRVEPRLFGYLQVPFLAGRTQARKTPSPSSESVAAASAVRGVIAQLRPGVRYLLGPGSTIAELGRQLGVATTPLGVDVLLDGQIVLTDATEQQLLAEISGRQAQAIVTIIGGQGFLLGRGNQQISASVVRELDPTQPLIVVAPEQKLLDLGGRPLLVDTGDAAVDSTLAGFARITTGVSSMSMYPVSAPEGRLTETAQRAPSADITTP